MNPETCRFFLISAVVGAVSGANIASKFVLEPPKQAEASSEEGKLQKISRHVQSTWVNSVSQTGSYVPLDGYRRGSKTDARFVDSLNGNDIIPVTVDEQDRRMGDNFPRQMLRPGQKTGKSDNGANPLGTARANVQGDHGSLTETDQSQSAGVKPERRKLGVKKSVKRAARGRNASPSLPRIAKRKRKPLTTAEARGQRLGRVRGYESGVWQ